MRTSKAISTISYNSDEFLEDKIKYWKNCGIIEFGMWIRHKPEGDENKSHCHVFLQPSRLIQTMDLELDSCEIDPLNPNKPLKMVKFRISKEYDWVLYGIHDPVYLMEKGLTREFHYSFDDIKSTCEDTLNDIIANLADTRKGKLEYKIIDCVNRGFTWSDIVKSGIIPLRSIGGAKLMYEALTGQSNTY